MLKKLFFCVFCVFLWVGLPETATANQSQTQLFTNLKTKLTEIEKLSTLLVENSELSETDLQQLTIELMNSKNQIVELLLLLEESKTATQTAEKLVSEYKISLKTANETLQTLKRKVKKQKNSIGPTILIGPSQTYLGITFQTNRYQIGYHSQISGHGDNYLIQGTWNMVLW